jgi:KAP family P-loop domain
LPGHPNESAAKDGLVVAPFIDSVQRALRATETPFVYGLLGDWGTGKTSVLRPLEGRLKQELETGPGALVPIWFNVRHYENEVSLVYPLLYALRHAQQADRRITALAGARSFGGMLARVAATSALAFSDVALRAATQNLAGEACQ